MTKEPANFCVFRADEYGFPKFADGGFYTRPEARRISATLPDTFVLSYGEYVQGADIDDLSERKGRAREGIAPAARQRVAVITGIFPNNTRAELKRIAEQAGYAVRKVVTSFTSILIAGDKPGPAKIKTATALGIPVVTTIAEITQGT